MDVELFNFDHTFIIPGKFPIGPFQIIITREHCNNLKKLSRSIRHSYKLDENLNRVVIQKPKIVGGWVNTATAKIDEKYLTESRLIPEVRGINLINDLCLLFTFLTGRRVTTENCLEYYNPQIPFDSPVYIHNIISWGNQCWNNLINIKNKGLEVPFVNLCDAYESSHLLGLAAYINSTLNAIYDIWWDNEEKSFIKKNIRKRIRKKLQSTLKKSISYSIKKKLVKILKDENIGVDIIDDIKKKINSIGSPSALYKLTKFLQYLGVYPNNKEENEEHRKRLRYINHLRNHLFHSGNIPQNRDVSNDQAIEISGSIILLNLLIDQFYFSSKLLQIHDSKLDSTKRNIIDYFQTGRFKGKDVYSENYFDFLKRRNDTWINEGILIG